MKSVFSRGLGYGLLGFGFFGSASALAQSEDDQTATESLENALPVILVTAQKRSESLQDVPLSVTAVSGEALESRQIIAASDLQFVVPGLNFNGSGASPRIAGFNVRGIGTNIFSESIESSVAMVVDGVVMGRQGAALMDMNDLSRVEVLRGPQGTLFGKNASAGVIHLVTRDPTWDLTAEAGASFGNFGSVRANAVVSGPIVNDRLAVRVSGFLNRRDGFVTNLARGEDLNDSDQQGLRIKALWEPTDRLSVRLGLDYAEFSVACCITTTRSYGSGVQGSLLPPPFQVNPIRVSDLGSGILAGPENIQVNADALSRGRQKSRGVMGQIDYEIGENTLTSISAYRRWSNDDETDYDLTALPILSENSSIIRQEQFSQEIRFASPGERSFSYVLGAFYFWQSSDSTEVQSGTLGFDLLPPIFPPPFSFFWPTPPGTILSREQSAMITTENLAVFGEARVRLGGGFSLFGGVRILTEKQSVDVARTVNPASIALSPLIGSGWAPLSADGSQRDEAVVWRAGVDFQATDDILMFGSFSRGYKGAGFNVELGLPDLRRVSPEIPESVEVGIKSSWFDNRLVLNASAFHTTFADFQAQTLVSDPATGITNFLIANAGKLRTQGVEIEATASPIAGLTLGASLNYLDAVYKNFENAPCYVGQTEAQGCIPVAPGVSFQDLGGARLNNAPNWKWTIDGRYEFDLGSDRRKSGFLQAAYAWRSDALSSANNDPNTLINSYGLLDGSIGVRWESGFELSLFGRNILDQHFDDLIFPQPFDAGGYVNFPSFAARRTYGISARLWLP